MDRFRPPNGPEVTLKRLAHARAAHAAPGRLLQCADRDRRDCQREGCRPGAHGAKVKGAARRTDQLRSSQRSISAKPLVGRCKNRPDVWGRTCVHVSRRPWVVRGWVERAAERRGTSTFHRPSVRCAESTRSSRTPSFSATAGGSPARSPAACPARGSRSRPFEISIFHLSQVA